MNEFTSRAENIRRREMEAAKKRPVEFKDQALQVRDQEVFKTGWCKQSP